MSDKQTLGAAIVAAADKNYDEFKTNIEQVAEPRLFAAVKRAIDSCRSDLFKRSEQ